MPELPSVTDPAGVIVLPVPTCLVTNDWLKLAVSPDANDPDVIVGVPDDAVVPSYTRVCATADTVIARAVTTPSLLLANVTL